MQALVDMADDGEIDLYAMRTQAMSKISAGGGELAFVSSGTINGKTVNREIRMDAAEMLGAVNKAIRVVNGKAVSVTYSDFSSLS